MKALWDRQAESLEEIERANTTSVGRAEHNTRRHYSFTRRFPLGEVQPITAAGGVAHRRRLYRRNPSQEATRLASDNVRQSPSSLIICPASTENKPVLNRGI